MANVWDRLTGRAALVERVTALERALGESKPVMPVVVASGNTERDRLSQTPRAGRTDAVLLRAVADQVALVRAALNAKKRHVGALRVEVRGPDEATALALQALVAKPAPDHTWRQWISEVLEDVLVLDAATVYVWPRRNRTLYGLLPVDAATIAILPDARGMLPEPPLIAYEQRIAGGVTARLTKQELIYEMMNPRAHSLYGLSPTEVVLQAALTQLRRMTGSAEMLDSSNMAAFFGELPEGWGVDQIGEYQRYWDQMTASRSHKGVWGPHGSDVKFPPQLEIKTDFDYFLLYLICAVFEVQPQELGFTTDVNRATGEVQEDITKRRSMRPLAELVGEIWQQAFALTGYGEYTLAWPELEERSHTEIRSDAAALVPIGVLTPNDVRAELHLEPLPGGDDAVDGRRYTVDGMRVSRALDYDPTQAPFMTQAPFIERAAAGIPMDIPAPDDSVELLRLQETLRLEYLEASQRLAVEALLDELREAQARGETVTPAMIGRAAAAIADAHGEAIRPTIIHSLQDMAAVGVQAGATAFEAAVNFTLDWTLANTYAAEWARTYGGQLITNMDATTKARIGAEVGTWAESREGYPDLLKRIRAIIDDPRRAELIAQTEPTNAYAAGNVAAWRQEEEELGVVIVEVWNTANDDLVCPICGPLNQQQRRIGEAFDGGIERPAAHPRCRCWLTSMMVLPKRARAALAARGWTGRLRDVG